MSRNIRLSAWTLSFVLVVGSAAFCTAASGAAEHHALVGELARVDKNAKRVTIKAADGTEHTLAYGDRTIVHELQGAAKTADLAGKEGSQVFVRYTGAGAHETAEHIDVFGHDALKTTNGTLVRVDQVGHNVVIKTSKGAEETYDLGQEAAVDTKSGITDAARFTAKEGDHVIVYHTEEGGHKVIHLLKHLEHSV